MNAPLKISMFLIACCAVLTTSQAAEDCNDSACLEKAYVEPSRINIANILGRFKPFIGKDAPYLYEKNAVRIRSFADFNAFANYADKQVIIPAFFVIETAFVCEAFSRASLDPRHAQEVKRYQRYLVERSEQARKKGGVDDIPIMNYAGFLKESAEDFKRAWTPELQSRVNYCMYESVAAVLAHEIGHLVLNHRSDSQLTPEQSREQEREADDFAIELAHNSGIDLTPAAATTLTRFAVRESLFDTGDPRMRTHPLAECRVYKFLNLAVIQGKRAVNPS